MSDFTICSWTPETTTEKQILREATIYLLCIKTFNTYIYIYIYIYAGDKETSHCSEQQCASQVAFKQDKKIEILATLREIKNRQSTKCKEFSPRAIPSKTEA